MRDGGEFFQKKTVPYPDNALDQMNVEEQELLFLLYFKF